MITRTYRYPEDPESRVDLMFGEEFLRLNPHREMVIYTGDELHDLKETERITISEILCDCCNEVVKEEDPCALTQNRLYCWKCAQEWILPHLVRR